MTRHKYTFDITEDMAVAVGRYLGISTRNSYEVCKYIRGKSLKRVKAFLANVMNQIEAVPYRRFNDNVAHKAGTGPGRYPHNASKSILETIESAEKNAKYKDMDVEKLVVAYAVANEASRPYRAGRHSRRYAKRSHIEIALMEKENFAKHVVDRSGKNKNKDKKAVESKPAAEKSAKKPASTTKAKSTKSSGAAKND